MCQKLEEWASASGYTPADGHVLELKEQRRVDIASRSQDGQREARQHSTSRYPGTCG